MFEKTYYVRPENLSAHLVPGELSEVTLFTEAVRDPLVRDIMRTPI